MMNGNDNYSINLKQFLAMLSVVKYQIVDDTDLSLKDVVELKRINGGRINNHKPHTIHIGTKCVYDSIKDGFVRDRDLVNVVFTSYHEKGHLLQKLDFEKTSVSDELKQMARIDLISRTMFEYYRPTRGYYHNICELDAESYGIRNCRDFFQ